MQFRLQSRIKLIKVILSLRCSAFLSLLIRKSMTDKGAIKVLSRMVDLEQYLILVKNITVYTSFKLYPLLYNYITII